MSTKEIFKTALAAVAALFSTAMAQSNYTVDLSGLGNNKTLDMVFVEGGTYKRGCSTNDNACEATEKPAHDVTLSSYYIGKYEVTNAHWKAVMGDNTTANNQPKTMITWYDAVEFTCKLREKTGKRYRLATDAEFEYAARGGKNKSAFLYSGSNTAGDVAWTSANAGGGYGAKDVGGKTANALGIYDMSGNVYEWTHDSWGNYPSSGDAMTNPIDRPTAHTQKTRRGGSYDQLPSESRVSARKIRSIEGKDGSIGLRVALSVSDSDPAAQINPCDIHQPPPSGGKIGLRDERLITEDDEAWIYDMSSYVAGFAYVLRISANGAAKYAMLMNGTAMDQASGEWYTLNSFSLNIVPTSGTAKKYIYYLIDNDNMSMMPDGGMPGRYVRTKISSFTGANKVTLPTIASPKTPEQLAPANGTIDMANPPTTGRDKRLIEGTGYAWVQDNVAMNAGGTHRYRKDFDSESDMRFVVWDAGAGTSTLLAHGQWFTVDNTFLRVKDPNGATYDYLYTVTANGDTLYHISFQSYEPGDFRMFKKMSASSVPQWKEPTSNTTYNQGASTYIPPSDNPVLPSSSSRASSSSAAVPSSSSSAVTVSSSSSRPGSSSSTVTVSSSSGSGTSSSSGSGTSSSSSNGTSSSSSETTPIRLPQIASSNILARATGNSIILENLPQNAKVELYNLNGKRVYSAHSENSQILKIQVQTKGMYVVKASFGSENKTLRIPVM